MIEPSHRDAILRLQATSHDFAAFLTHVSFLRQAQVEAIVYMSAIESTDISRLQGRIHALDEILNIPDQAQTELDNSKRTENHD